MVRTSISDSLGDSHGENNGPFKSIQPFSLDSMILYTFSGYGCFNLKAGDIRRLDHEKINVNVCNLSGFLFDGGPDKEWAQKPFSREGKESRYFCPGKIKWTRQDIGRKKKIKAQPAPAPAQSKFSKQVQQQVRNSMLRNS